jgi:LysM repeat protein
MIGKKSINIFCKTPFSSCGSCATMVLHPIGMPMKYIVNKLLLFLLRLAVYGKRTVAWVFFRLVSIFSRLHDVYASTLGFRVYKFGFLIRKKLEKYKIPLDSRIVEILAKRGTLQVALFVVILAILLPHSKLYSQDIASLPGRNTLLYSLVGPGEQDYDTEEIIIEEAHLDRPKSIDASAWKAGTVSVDVPSTVGKEVVPVAQDIAAVSVGGTAFTKPIILSGTVLPTISKTSSQQRSETITYEVQSGDVIGAIAELHGISVNSILWANGLSARSYIRPGDILKIPPSTGLYHKVGSGDTVSKIARLYDIEADEIVVFNKLQKDGADIVVGEELFIPEGVKPTPRVVYAPRPKPFVSVTAPAPSVSAPAGSGYLWPTSVYRITQYFGWRHTGLDIAGPVGSPLYASRAGTVIKSQCGWNGGYGCYVIVDHGGGVQTLYAHASRLYVSAGQQVSQGQTLADMGSTGRSTGPHIHYEVRVNGRHQNPLQYIRK